MTDMNQSFIRAFAKKNAAVNSQQGKPATASEAKPSRRGAMISQGMESIVASKTVPSKLAPAARPKAESPSSIASLLHSESVLVFSSFVEDADVGNETRTPAEHAVWTPQAAESAQAAAAQVPRGVAAKSKIPAPPKSISQPHFGAKKTVQRVDIAHKTAPSLPKITPAWEVDSLLWPRTCDQLLAAERPYFEEAAGRLVEASRQGMRTLAICESRRGEGCSTVALCIAKSAAATGLRIGILDADFQSDGLAEMLGLEVDCNWTEAAADAAAIHEHSVQLLDQPITLFPLSREGRETATSTPGASLSLIPQIAEQFDLLIVDFGVCNDGALAQALSSRLTIDAALVVRDLRHTSSRSVHATVSQIRESGIEAVGIAENFGAR